MRWKGGSVSFGEVGQFELEGWVNLVRKTQIAVGVEKRSVVELVNGVIEDLGDTADSGGGESHVPQEGFHGFLHTARGNACEEGFEDSLIDIGTTALIAGEAFPGQGPSAAEAWDSQARNPAKPGQESSGIGTIAPSPACGAVAQRRAPMRS